MLLLPGRYRLAEPVVIRSSGRPDAWLTIRGEPGAILDASAIEIGEPEGTPPFPQDHAAVLLERVHHVRVSGLQVVDSHNAGISARNASHLEIVGNKTRNTFSSGISVWDCQEVRIAENLVERGNDAALAPAWFRAAEMFAPHESISLGGVEGFVVQGNHVHHGFKEGIDIKGDSKHGVVADNHVHDMDWQGIYVDAWDGPLVDVEVQGNDVHHCRGAGIVVSAEGEGASVEDVRIRENRIVDNLGSGIFVARFGLDGPRRRLLVVDNLVWHNGWGPPHESSPYHWITGGVYLFSAHVEDVQIRDNVIVDNRGFQIGVADDYAQDGIEQTLRRRRVRIEHNVVLPVMPDDSTPVRTGWPKSDPDAVHPIEGAAPIRTRPAALEDPWAGCYEQSAAQ